MAEDHPRVKKQSDGQIYPSDGRELNKQEPGTMVSRFVGDVDMVENLFTSGIISMFADACKIISILVVIWFENKGLAVVLLVILPFFSGLPDMCRKTCWQPDRKP